MLSPVILCSDKIGHVLVEKSQTKRALLRTVDVQRRLYNWWSRRSHPTERCCPNHTSLTALLLRAGVTVLQALIRYSQNKVVQMQEDAQQKVPPFPCQGRCKKFYFDSDLYRQWNSWQTLSKATCRPLQQEFARGDKPVAWYFIAFFVQFWEPGDSSAI